MSSFRNIEAIGLASLTFPSFTNGSLLYVTGIAHNLVGTPAQAIMPSQNALTTIEITGYIFIEDALPVRQREGTDPQRSMHAPPVKLLREEQASSTYFSTEDAMHVTLSRIRLILPISPHSRLNHLIGLILSQAKPPSSISPLSSVRRHTGTWHPRAQI
jgi:hypothetical protein